MYIRLDTDFFQGCNLPDVYHFKYLGHDWDLIETEHCSNDYDHPKMNQYYIRMTGYALIYHVIGVYADENIIFDTPSFIQDVKDTCCSYCSILDQIGGW